MKNKMCSWIGALLEVLVVVVGGEKIVAAMAASLTVTQLRKELTKRALDTTGLKPALVGFLLNPCIILQTKMFVCMHIDTSLAYSVFNVKVSLCIKKYNLSHR